MLSVAPQQQETQYVTILHREPAEGLMVVSDAGKTLWRDRYGRLVTGRHHPTVGDGSRAWLAAAPYVDVLSDQYFEEPSQIANDFIVGAN